MFPFKWTPLVLNIFDKNVKSQPEGRKGRPQAFSAAAASARKASGPASAAGGASRARGGQAASAGPGLPAV